MEGGVALAPQGDWTLRRPAQLLERFRQEDMVDRDHVDTVEALRGEMMRRVGRPPSPARGGSAEQRRLPSAGRQRDLFDGVDVVGILALSAYELRRQLQQKRQPVSPCILDLPPPIVSAGPRVLGGGGTLDIPKEWQKVHGDGSGQLVLDGKPVGWAGVHVFVDSSNIHIGFRQAYTTSVGMHRRSRYRGPRMCFDALAKLMERGRTVTRRVIVGSAPLLLEWKDDAEELGYSVEMRQWVLKQVVDADAIPDGNPRHGRLVWAEDGVDERLQFQMLESLCSRLCGTMVVATGDGSDTVFGFNWRDAVEMILERGWFVELMTWKQSMSSAYRSEDFLRKWKGQFRIIVLDPFLDLLCQRDPPSNGPGGAVAEDD